MKVSTLGIDLAKNVFQLHGVGCNGQTVLKKKLTRDKFLPFLMQLEPCLIGHGGLCFQSSFCACFTAVWA
ncbi:putative transposase [Yersinia enterocolitica]|nr:putative transposase [Yersinia enterocolitica]